MESFDTRTKRVAIISPEAAPVISATPGSVLDMMLASTRECFSRNRTDHRVTLTLESEKLFT